jgi:hypothetical protein
MTPSELEDDLRATFERAAGSVPFVPHLASRVTGDARQRRRRAWTVSGAAAASIAILVTAGALWQSGAPTPVPTPAPAAASPVDPTTALPVLSVRARLIGTWRPVRVDGFPRLQEPRPEEPLLTFAANGKWSGSDGCNSLGGTFTVTAEGGFSSVARGHRLAGCVNVPHGGLLAETAKVSVDGSTLRLLASDGQEVANYVRVR